MTDKNKQEMPSQDSLKSRLRAQGQPHEITGKADLFSTAIAMGMITADQVDELLAAYAIGEHSEVWSIFDSHELEE